MTEAATTRPGHDSSRRRANRINSIATVLANRLPPGDRAQLRRLSPSDPASPAFHRLMARYFPDKDKRNDEHDRRHHPLRQQPEREVLSTGIEPGEAIRRQRSDDQ